jgi:hypothetical protein
MKKGVHGDHYNSKPVAKGKYPEYNCFLNNPKVSKNGFGLSLPNREKDLKRRLFPLLISALCLLGPSLSWAQSQPLDPASGKETVQAETTQSTGPKANKKSKSGSSPKAQIKEGGKEIGEGFKDLGQGIGRGFKNMGKIFKKAWTGGGE